MPVARNVFDVESLEWVGLLIMAAVVEGLLPLHPHPLPRMIVDHLDLMAKAEAILLLLLLPLVGVVMDMDMSKDQEVVVVAAREVVVIMEGRVVTGKHIVTLLDEMTEKIIVLISVHSMGY